MNQAEFAFVDMIPVASPPAPRLQRIRRVQELAGKLLRAHGLHAWGFAYNRRKRAMGFCCYSRRSIELSIHFVVRNDMDAIVDTILHEIAHALVGPDHGHDKVWKAKCREIGATPQRCGQADMPLGQWHATCTACGREYNRHRRPKLLARLVLSALRQRTRAAGMEATNPRLEVVVVLRPIPAASLPAWQWRPRISPLTPPSVSFLMAL